MVSKQKKVKYKVSGFGYVMVYDARYPANAVAQFRKEFKLPIKADHVEGDWPGVKVQRVGE